jgi:hypothetical protein
MDLDELHLNNFIPENNKKENKIPIPSRAKLDAEMLMHVCI